MEDSCSLHFSAMRRRPLHAARRRSTVELSPASIITVDTMGRIAVLVINIRLIRACRVVKYVPQAMNGGVELRAVTSLVT